MEPKLRSVNKAVPPYDLNKFPSKFINVLAQNLVYLEATKPTMSVEGDEWEQIFAECIGAEWKPSNIGLDDVVLDDCCWSAKTVFGMGDLEKQDKVRLISGRNSPTFSFGVDKIATSDPDYIGGMVLDIWNERVSSIRQFFKFARTVVLVKSKDYRDYLVFEFDTIRYEPDLYSFSWNSRGNLEGYEKSSGDHRFTWQPHGSQFTIIEEIPKQRIHLSVRQPQALDKETVLKNLNFDKSWYSIISKQRP